MILKQRGGFCMPCMTTVITFDQDGSMGIYVFPKDGNTAVDFLKFDFKRLGGVLEIFCTIRTACFAGENRIRRSQSLVAAALATMKNFGSAVYIWLKANDVRMRLSQVFNIFAMCLSSRHMHIVLPLSRGAGAPPQTALGSCKLALQYARIRRALQSRLLATIRF